MSQVLFFRCATMRLELGELFGLAISWKAELMSHLWSKPRCRERSVEKSELRAIHSVLLISCYQHSSQDFPISIAESLQTAALKLYSFLG